MAVQNRFYNQARRCRCTSSVKLVSEDPSAVAKALIILPFCRTFWSGGTRIRTGDTMIFSLVPFSSVDRRK